MKYELLLQAPPGEPFDPQQAFAALSGRVPFDPPLETVGEPGPREWKLAPDGNVDVRPWKEAGRVVALEVHIPLAESDTLLRRTTRETTEAAKASGLVVYDPQLNRAIGVADEESVAAHYDRTVRYVGQMVGMPGLTGVGVDPEPPGMKVGAKVLLGLIGLVFLLLMLSNLITRLILHH